MIRTQVSLESQMYEEARREAARRGISFAELVRQALGAMLGSGNRDQPWMRFSGALDLADPDASASVDEVVYGRDRP